MQLTPFTYVLEANKFALKNFENLIRLCLFAAVIGTIFAVLDFGNSSLIAPDSLSTSNNNIIVMEQLTVDLFIVLIVNFILSIMFSVPYIQYAYQKQQQPDLQIRPTLQMSMHWNPYKTAYLKASISVLLITVLVLFPTVILLNFVNIPPLFMVVIIILEIIFLLRLHLAMSAAALGDDASIKRIWHMTKPHTMAFVILIITYLASAVVWGLAISILSKPFLNLGMLWSDIMGHFIQIIISYAMTLVLAHSFMTLYTKISTTPNLKIV